MQLQMKGNIPWFGKFEKLQAFGIPASSETSKYYQSFLKNDYQTLSTPCKLIFLFYSSARTLILSGGRILVVVAKLKGLNGVTMLAVWNLIANGFASAKKLDIL